MCKGANKKFKQVFTKKSGGRYWEEQYGFGRIVGTTVATGLLR